MLCVLLSLLCLAQVLLSASSTDEEPEYAYGILIDAGSQHSGLFIYQWTARESKNSSSPKTVPEQMGHLSIRPGVSTCCSSQHEINTYLQPLMDWAVDKLTNGDYASLDRSDLKRVDLHVKATAGMRILEEESRQQTFSWIRTFFSNNTLSPFGFKDEYAQIIAGEEEGAFGWLSVNLLLRKLHDNKLSPNAMVGALDLGGQSTQISFTAIPSGDILQGFTSIRLWGANHRLYSHSFLTFGVLGFMTQMAQLSLDIATANGDSLVRNPCLFTGDEQGYEGLVDENGDVINGTVLQVGDSQSGLCGAYAKALFHNETECVAGTCPILGVYQPQIPRNMTFYAFSNFAWLIDIMGIGKNQSKTVGGVLEVAEEICAMNYSTFMNSTYGQSMVDEGEGDIRYSACVELMEAAQLLLVYGFERNSTQVRFEDHLKGKKLGWTLGSMLRDVNWMSFEIESRRKRVNEESNADKAYRTATWTLVSMFGSMVVCVLFLVGKRCLSDDPNGRYLRFKV